MSAEAPALVRIPYDAPVEQMLAAMNRDGGFILEDALSPAMLERVRAELGPYIEATEPGKSDFGGKFTTRTGALIARSEAVRQMAVDPKLTELVGKFLEPAAERYQLHLSQVIRLQPGQPAQRLHRDQHSWSRRLDDMDVEFSAIFAITDFTAENGATLAVPGSGNWPSERVASIEEACPAVMRAGSAILYSGRMWHGGGENVSRGDRIGLQLSYAAAWLRQEENQYLSCPPEVAKGLPTEVTRLIGYDMGRYALGYYSPPVGPGLSLEVVNPEHALTGRGIGSYVGTADSAEGIMAENDQREAAARERAERSAALTADKA